MVTVSIITPVYNAQNYLNKCIDSLLSQSFSDFELILVNDGSKDSSGEICDEYAKCDSRVRVIHKENGGVSSARNMGLDVARGKYIMFCDSDDYVYPDFCNPLVDLAGDSDSCLVLAGITELRGNTQKDALCPAFAEGENRRYTKQEFCDLYVELNLKSPFLLMNMPYNKLFSRDIIEKNKIRFNSAIHYNEDFIFNLDYLSCVDDIRIYNKSIYYYYMDAPGSLCKKYIPDIISMYKAKEDKLKSIICDNATDKDGAHKVWCNMVFADVHRAINNTFSQSNPQTKSEKYKYCSKLIRDKAFKIALKGADKKGYHPIHIKLLKLGSFRLLMFFKKFK